jgi:hypothetical protein
MTSTIKIFDIKVGRHHRSDLGDIAGLAASIEKIGLLYPVVATSDSTLIAGERCLAAFFKLLGRDRILPRPSTSTRWCSAKFAENTERQDFTASPAEATCSGAGERNRTLVIREAIGNPCEIIGCLDFSQT